MQMTDRAAALVDEAARLVDACVADLDARVPGCPGWDTRQLLRHTHGAWNAFAEIVASGSLDAPDPARFGTIPDDDAALVDSARAAAERLGVVLGTADPGAPVWSWNGPRTQAFYARRAHLETLVHRVDAERATAHATPVDPATAFDAVDELFTELVGRPEPVPAGTFHLHQTDGAGELMLSARDGVIEVAHEHAKGDAALRATGGELMEVMWGRRGLDGLEFFGDETVAGQWIALAP